MSWFWFGFEFACSSKICFQRLIKKVRACLFSMILSVKWRFSLYRTFLQSPFSWNFPSQLVFLEFILGSPDTMFMSFEQRSANSESFLCYLNPLPWPLYFVICLSLSITWQHYHPVHVTSDIIAIMRIPSSTTGSKPICVLAPTLEKTNSKFIQHAGAI